MNLSPVCGVAVMVTVRPAFCQPPLGATDKSTDGGLLMDGAGAHQYLCGEKMKRQTEMTQTQHYEKRREPEMSSTALETFLIQIT